MAKPVVRAAITSLWSPNMERACVAIERAATWITAGASSPAILNRLGSMSNRPWEAVKVVASVPACNRPCSVPAAPASDCISITSGTAPHRLGRPAADHVGVLAHRRRRRDRVDGDRLGEGVGNPGDRLVAVDVRRSVRFALDL